MCSIFYVFFGQSDFLLTCTEAYCFFQISQQEKLLVSVRYTISEKKNCLYRTRPDISVCISIEEEEYIVLLKI